MVNLKRILAVLAIALLPLQSLAHQLSTGYLTLNQTTENSLTGNWQVRWLDLHNAVALDDNQDGQLTWREVLQHKSDILDYLTARLTLDNTTGTCALQVNPVLQTTSHFNEGYLFLAFSANCADIPSLTLNYDAFFDVEPQHKVLTTVVLTNGTISRVLSVNQPHVTLDIENNSQFQTFVDYLKQGIIHIWIGLDHILFLLALLLTAVLIRQDKEWIGITSPGNVLKNTIWIITAFTLAHSITLTATAMNWIDLNTTWVELSIALSVLFAALNNIWPLIIRLGWLTFGFGLIHGFGFASVLIELGLPPNQMLTSVLAFNLGVEVGQLAILFVIFPLLLLVRGHSWYRKGGMQLASAGIGVMAIVWSLERL